MLPACAYPLIFFADWSYAYLVDSRHIPSAVVLALLLIDGAAPAAGFGLARRVLRREALGVDPVAHAAALALAIVPFGVALLLSILLSPRLAVEGTLAMVTGAFGTSPLWKSPLGYVLVWLAGTVGCGAWLTARALGMAKTNTPHNVASPPSPPKQRFLGDSGRKQRGPTRSGVPKGGAH